MSAVSQAASRNALGAAEARALTDELRQAEGAPFAASRRNGCRPKGYATWRPQAKSKALLVQIEAVFAEYADYLPLTVRQIFYRLVGAFGYDKTEQAYERLGNLLVRARRARLVGFDAIRDDGVTTFSADWYAGIESFHDETARRARAYRLDRQAGQSKRIELWCEAAGMLPQLARVADAFSVPVFSSGGFSSLTAVRLIADRALAIERPTLLLHVGDFDPSGESIFEALAQDAAAFVEDDRVIAPQRIHAARVALTSEQVDAHELPTAPPKRSDSRSHSWAGETCQLEALPPDVLATLVRGAIEDNIDETTYRIVLDAERQQRAQLLGLPPGAST